ncbi:FAD-dependent monooxygenase [Agarilytica rhodophyticola]|uniref:FAD-dependent monooxygenase n=1 Tax=Agarilytica rhodophyticola TaxID=1737490 RepID=UPI000B34893C|nr:FAD-dependent monooxygenase [Agarilytica rhodophyticola]
MKKMKVVIVGAGPTGAFLAAALGKQGHKIILIDRRADPIKQNDKRTIQLSLSPRGKDAIEALGLQTEFEQISIPLKNRIFHLPDGKVDIRSYPDNGCELFSVSRVDIAKILIHDALKQGSIETHFGSHCCDVLDSTESARVILRKQDNAIVELDADLVIGADGVSSNVRKAITRNPMVNFAKTITPHGYMEWTISAEYAKKKLSASAPHIWPRSQWLLVSFPCQDGRHRGTFVTTHKLWQQMKSENTIEQTLREQFSDVFPHLETPLEHIINSELLPMTMVRSDSYYNGKKILIVGDAAHGVAPFMGQGVNLALEEAATLVKVIKDESSTLEQRLTEFSQAQVIEGLACCDLSQQAGYTLLEKPSQQKNKVDPLIKLNFSRASYQSVTQETIAGWYPSVQVTPGMHSLPPSFSIPNDLKNRYDLEEGKTIFQCGDTAESLFLIESGDISITDPSDGHSVRLKAPIIIGEEQWFDSDKRKHTVRTESLCSIAKVPYQKLEQYCLRLPAAGLALVRGLASVSLSRNQTEKIPTKLYTVLLTDSQTDVDTLFDWLTSLEENLSTQIFFCEKEIARLLISKFDLEINTINFSSEETIGKLQKIISTGLLRRVVPFTNDLPKDFLNQVGEEIFDLIEMPLGQSLEVTPC